MLDGCAAPGGKSLILQGEVTAVELHPGRAEAMAKRMPPNVRVVTADLRELDESGFDRALVDAPCSGLGVLARRPDLRWRASPLPDLQLELLRAAAERTRPGGTVVYSVCTLNADENEAVVDAAGLEIEPLGDEWPQYAHPTRPEFLLTRPDRDRTAGFFIARLRVVGSRACPGRSGSATVEVEPSLYGADFAHLGEQIEVLLRAGVRIFHFDVGDGHFVEPITMGPIVLESIAPMIHERGRQDRRASDGRRARRSTSQPSRPQAATASPSTIEAVDDVRATIRAAREQELQVGLAFNPETEPEAVARVRRRRRPRALHEHPSRLLRPAVPGGGVRARPRGCARASPTRSSIQVDGGVKAPQRQAALRRGRAAARRRVGDLRARGSDACLPPARAAAA